MLVPGVRVVPRGRDRLQVGLERPVLLRRTTAAETALSALATGDLPAQDPETRAVLDALTEARLVLPGDPRGSADLEPGDLAALALAHPETAVARLARRARAVLEVRGSLGVDPWPLLRAAGVNPRRGAADLALVLCAGEPRREELDLLVRDRVPHLVVRMVDGLLTVGPYVVPGRTACVRCIDSHREDEEPGHQLVVDRYSRLAGRPRGDAMPEPLDHALATLGVAWAVRDLVSAVDGDRPSTWSSTLRIGPDLSATQAVAWLRHPECGCAWDRYPSAAEGLSGTLDR